MKDYHVYIQSRPCFYQAEVVDGKEFEIRLLLLGVPAGPCDVPDAKTEFASSQIAKL